jgi:hypothetical protein
MADDYAIRVHLSSVRVFAEPGTKKGATAETVTPTEVELTH